MRAPQLDAEALEPVRVCPRTPPGSREPCTGRLAMIGFSRFSASGQWCGQLSGHPQSPDRPGRSLSRRNLLKPSYVTPENRLRHPSAAAPPSKKLAACASVPLRTERTPRILDSAEGGDGQESCAWRREKQIKSESRRSGGERNIVNG